MIAFGQMPLCIRRFSEKLDNFSAKQRGPPMTKDTYCMVANEWLKAIRNWTDSPFTEISCLSLYSSPVFSKGWLSQLEKAVTSTSIKVICYTNPATKSGNNTILMDIVEFSFNFGYRHYALQWKPKRYKNLEGAIAEISPDIWLFLFFNFSLFII